MSKRFLTILQEKHPAISRIITFRAVKPGTIQQNFGGSRSRAVKAERIVNVALVEVPPKRVPASVEIHCKFHAPMIPINGRLVFSTFDKANYSPVSGNIVAYFTARLVDLSTGAITSRSARYRYADGQLLPEKIFNARSGR